MKGRVVARMLLICLLLSLLTACGGDDGAPEGFYLASDPDTDGFCFYVPDEWTVQRTSGIVTAYLSDLSSANISAAYVRTDETDIETYFAASEVALVEDFTDYGRASAAPDALTVDGHSAYLYCYDGTYAGVRYGFHQYFILTGDDPSFGMYVITYTAAKDANARTGTVDYDETVKTAAAVVQNFRLRADEPCPRADLAVTDAPAPDGMKKANRFTRLGMDLYVPVAWRVDLSDGFVGAVTEDGASVGVHALSYEAAVKKLDHYETGVSESGFTQADYWHLLQAEYAELLDAFTVEEEPDWEAEGADAVTTGECTYRAFTFTGVKGSGTYRVTVYLLWQTARGRDMYLLTYTATPETYGTHLPDVERILEAIRFD